ncbi:MAG: hypothetical protein JWN00_6079 [Actinomycetia bacterium]|nr:hypothetical protein [Actinomycetes bacterium]
MTSNPQRDRVAQMVGAYNDFLKSVPFVNLPGVVQPIDPEQVQIIKEIGFRKQSGFQIFTVATLLDGRVSVGVDNPGVARKALARYGPYLVIAKGAPARPD